MRTRRLAITARRPCYSPAAMCRIWSKFSRGFHLAMVDGTCFTPKMSLLTRFLVFAAGAACLPSASYAEPRNGPRLEEPACQPLSRANEALAKIPTFRRLGTP